MRRVALFVEDFAHEAFLKAMVQRFADVHSVEVAFQPYSVRGGSGKVVRELRQFILDLGCGRRKLPDLLIVGRDANCQGLLKRRQELEPVAGQSGCAVVYAIPDPHIERWLLIDSAAFKTALGHGCQAPQQKCERRLFKRLLLEAVRAAGVTPLLGGIEHTEALVAAMNLQSLESADESLGRLLKDLRSVFNTWKRA